MSKPSAVIRHLVAPSEEELHQSTIVLAEAFQYRYFLSSLGGDQSLERPFIRAHLDAAVVGGQIDVAEIGGVGIVGVAIWFGPGQKFLSSEEQRHAGWEQVMELLQPKFRSWWDYFLAAYDKLCEGSFGPRTKLSSYHLQLIGVAPGLQKRGIGSLMIKSVERKACKTGTPLCLETTAGPNISYYESIGFNSVGSEIFKSASDSSFEMFCLLKQTKF